MPTQNDSTNQLRGVNSNLALLVERFATAFPMGASQGTFTCAAAASTVVTDANVKATSTILLTPTNAAAGTLQGDTTHLYLSARSSGTSFTVSTSDAASAAGTETFQYIIVNLG